MHQPNYDLLRRTFPAGREHERVYRDHEVYPDFRIEARGSWTIVGCPIAIGSLADCEPERRHVDHLQMDDTLLIQFGLSGAVEFHLGNGQYYRQAGQRLSFFSFGNGRCIERVTSRGDPLRCVGIAIPIADLRALGCEPERLQEDLQALLELGVSHPSLVNFGLTPQQFAAADDLLTNRYTGPLRTHFVNAKIAELTCLAIDQLMQRRRGRGGDMTSLRSSRDRDDQALEIAINLLSREIGDGCSIADLARRVGLNRNKLIAGFKQRFGLTPTGFAKQARLNHARALIETSPLSIREVAWRVGFTSQSSFTRAYGKAFGTAPRRQRAARDLNRAHSIG